MTSNDPEGLFKHLQELERELPREPEYRKCFVAFLDILGFKEFINTAGADAPKLMVDVYRAFRFAREANYRDNTIEHRMFSDSVMIWCEHKNPHSVWNFLNQVELVRETFFKHGLLVRGGISYGDHFCAAEVVVSPALVKSYQLEQTAVYPRIRLEDAILDLDDMRICPLPTGSYIVPHGGMSLIVVPGKLRADTEGETCLCPFRHDPNILLLLTGNTENRVPGDAEHTPEQVMAFKEAGLQRLREHRDRILSRRSKLGPTTDTGVRIKVQYLVREFNDLLEKCRITDEERSPLRIG